MEIFKLFGSIFVDTDDADEKISKTDKNSQSLGGTLGNVAKSAAQMGLVIGTAAITVATAIGGMAVNTAKDVDKAVGSYIASTGTAKEESEKFETVLTNIYKNNYGEDFQDIADSMSQVKTQLNNIGDTELQNVTEDALALRDTFGYEVNESVRATKMLMDQFGISSSEAYNLIAQGAQQGLDKNGDLLDSINEYSVHFKQNGLNATDMFNTFKLGAENGAFSIDKVGDAIKEMGIRMKDGSATDSLKAMKLNANDISDAFGQGGDKASWAFGQVIDGLKNIKDPIKQNTAGVAIFGTMWEDLGAEAVLSMTQYGNAFDETLDSMNQLKEVKYDNLSDMFEGLKRNAELLLLPLGNALMPILTKLINLVVDNMPMIQGIFEQMTPVITQLFEKLMPPIMDIIQSLLPVLFDLFQELMPVITQILQSVLPVIIELINMLLPPIMQIIEMVLPILVQLINFLLPLLQPILGLLQPIIEVIMAIIEPLMQLLNFILPPLIAFINMLVQVIIPVLSVWIGFLSDLITSVISTVVTYFTNMYTNIKNIFTNIIDFIKNVFTGNWQGAWENIKNIFSNIVGGFANLFKTPLNLIIDGINAFIKGVNKIQLPNWDILGDYAGKGFNFPNIPRLKIGMDYVPSDDYPALLHKGEAVLTAEENKEYRKNKYNNDKTENKINNVTINLYVQQMGEKEREEFYDFINEKFGFEY